jgi:hypothetical protein
MITCSNSLAASVGISSIGRVGETVEHCDLPAGINPEHCAIAEVAPEFGGTVKIAFGISNDCAEHIATIWAAEAMQDGFTARRIELKHDSGG